MRGIIGKNCVIDEGVVLGVRYKEGSKPPKIGNNAIIRYGTVIYDDVEIGDKFRTGHYVLIREQTRIGNNVLAGTMTIIDGYCELGNNIKIQTGVYIPKYTVIGNNVFIGPRAVLTNDKYPVRIKTELKGPIIEDGVTIGANATILPGVRIGENAFIAAGAIVTKDIPKNKLAMGVPAKIYDLPVEGVNIID